MQLIQCKPKKGTFFPGYGEDSQQGNLDYSMTIIICCSKFHMNQTLFC